MFNNLIARIYFKYSLVSMLENFFSSSLTQLQRKLERLSLAWNFQASLLFLSKAYHRATGLANALILSDQN